MRLIFFIGQIFFIPHLLLFLFSNNKCLIIEDLNANSNLEGKLWYKLSYQLLTNKYFRTLFYFRNRGLFANVLRIFYPKHSSFTIDVFSEIEGGLKMAHPYATIINAAKVGKNVYINHLVTIGEKDGKRPIIGDNVEIHANATIIGGISIGDDSIVGAGSVVVKDVPKRSVVVGNPARIIKTY